MFYYEIQKISIYILVRMVGRDKMTNRFSTQIRLTEAFYLSILN